jgi:AcrR family transcriptional regulator
MKVKNINISSKRTKEAIKKAFVELMNEKKELRYVTVTDLVKKAGITRSSFYTHYDNIYDVAKDFQDDTLDMIMLDNYEFKTIEDVYHYIDIIINDLKKNENTYRMLLSSNEPIIFLERIRKPCVDKIYALLSNAENTTDTNLKLDVEFFVDGIIAQFIKYFRMSNYCTLDELKESVKVWFYNLFFKK